MRRTAKYNLIRQNYEALETALNYKDQFYFNPPTILEYKKRRYIIKAGTGDTLTIYADANEIAILSQRDGLSYCGLELIDIKTGAEIENLFFNEADTTNPENPSFNFHKKPANKVLKQIFDFYLY